MFAVNSPHRSDYGNGLGSKKIVIPLGKYIFFAISIIIKLKR